MIEVISISTAGHTVLCLLVQMVARLTGRTLITTASCTRHAGRVALLAPLPVPPEALWTLGHAHPAQGFTIRLTISLRV